MEMESFSGQNRSKRRSENHPRNATEKVSKMMPKGSKMEPKWKQKAFPNHAKIDTKLDAEKGRKKDGKSIEKHEK